jgi:hypothetical protein
MDRRGGKVTTAGTGSRPGTPTKAYFLNSARDVKRGKVLSHRGRSTATQESRGKPLRAVTRRQLAKRRQKAVPWSEERTVTTRRTSRGGRGGGKYSSCDSGKRGEEPTATTTRTARGSTRRKRRKKILFQQLGLQGRAGS